MFVFLSALGVKGRFMAIVAGVLVAAMVLVSARAEAAGAAGAAGVSGVSGTAVLAQGAGMAAKPSTRVRELQRVLQRRGYDLGDRGVDGRFGPLTAAAVRRLQAQRGLAVDGVVGKQTRTALGLPRRAGASAAGRRSPAERSAAASPAHASKATDAHGSQATDAHGSQATGEAGSRASGAHGSLTAARKSTLSQPIIAAPATRPNSKATSGAGEDRSFSVVGAIVLWGVFAAFAALALAGLWRWVSRARQTRADTKRAPKDVATGSANGAVNGFALSLVAPDDVAAVAADGAVDGYVPSPVRERVIGYVTTCTDEWSPADEASAAAIEATCESSGLSLFEIVQDHQNGKTLDRPGLRYALERIAEGRAGGLVVSDLQRLSRSPQDLGVLMAWFRDADARLVALDLDLDTATPEGRQAAKTLMALGTAQSAGPRTVAKGGAQAPAHGRPAVKDRPELMARIAAMRAANMTLWQIADQFNAEGIATLRGGSQWRPSSIQAALGYRRPSTPDRLPALEKRGGNGA